MKKIILGISILFITITLSACAAQNVISTFVLSSDQEVFSFAAISTSSLLADSQLETLSSGNSTSRMSNQSQIQTIEEVQPYLEMFEQLLSQDNGLSVTESVSENPLYQKKIKFAVADIFGAPITYVMYYNETLFVEDEETSEENEIKYSIDGLLIVGSVEYQVDGKKEIEDDEEKLTFKSQIDENNYVESKYKTENDEMKFYITIVQNGIVVSESKIKIETEENKTKMVLEYNAAADSSKYSFKLENENGHNVLKIMYEITSNGSTERGKMKVEVLVDEITGITSYQIYVEPDGEEAFEQRQDRNIEHDEDEDDENDDEDEN